MNYAGYYSAINFRFFYYFICSVFFQILCVVSVVFLIKTLRSATNTHVLEKTDKVFMIIVCLLCISVFLIIGFGYQMPYYKDFPNINSNYTVAIGTVIGYDCNNYGMEFRGITFVEKETGRLIQIKTNCEKVYVDEVYEFIYLPNTGHGELIKNLNKY